MRIFIEYLREKLKYIFMYIAMFAVTLAVCYVYNTSLEPILYSFLLCSVAVIIAFIYDYYRFYYKYKAINKHTKLEHIYTLDMPESDDIIEREYQKLVNRLIEDNMIMAFDRRKLMTEMSDYYTMWVHQIKTPISAINLLLQIMESERTNTNVKELKQELFKVDFYVDSALQYIRLEDMSSDFKFDYYNIDKLVKKCVKKFASQFINRKLKIELGNLNYEVLTDEKWMVFVIEQILSNSIKYTNESGTIKIFMKETCNINDRILVIQDNGIGISPEDLPRIFERGFTGYNGRMDKKSTGIGLYLCQKALNKMLNKINIESEVGTGTSVMIDMSRDDIRHE